MIKCNFEGCPQNKFEGCCVECPHYEVCEDKCPDRPKTCTYSFYESSEIEVFQQESLKAIKKIGLIISQKAKLEAEEKEIRAKLQTAMELYAVKKFDSDSIKITYVEPSTKTTVDSAKLKMQLPDVYAKFSKTSNVKAYVKIELKGDKK
jgi:predicted phage-related endonuclease